MAEDACALLSRAFGEQRSPADLRWKFWASPAGPPYGFAARSGPDGPLLALALSQRRAIRCQGRDRHVGLLCDVATDPEARSGGSLLRATVTTLARGLPDELGIFLAYGGQVNPSLVTIGKRWFGFRVVLRLETWEFRLSSGPALRARIGAIGRLFRPAVDFLLRRSWRRPHTDLVCEEVSDFGPEFDELWIRHRDRYPLSFARDTRTLRWRWLENPVGGHRILLARRPDGEAAGWIIWREWTPEEHRIATVLDLWTGGDEEVVAALMDGARRAAARTGCTYLRFGVRRDGAEWRALHRLGPGRISPFEPADEVVVSVLPVTDREATPEERDFWELVTDGKNWYYTQGDSDYRD